MKIFQLLIIILFFTCLGCSQLSSVNYTNNELETSQASDFNLISAYKNEIINYLESDKDTVIIMERTACYGDCPTFQIVISSNGEIDCKGYNKANGIYDKSFTVGKSIISRIYEKVDSTKFFDLKDEYIDDCPKGNWTDASSIFLTVKFNDNIKIVHHYLGCYGFRDEVKLLELEARIESIKGDF